MGVGAKQAGTTRHDQYFTEDGVLKSPNKRKESKMGLVCCKLKVIVLSGEDLAMSGGIFGWCLSYILQCTRQTPLTQICLAPSVNNVNDEKF